MLPAAAMIANDAVGGKPPNERDHHVVDPVRVRLRRVSGGVGRVGVNFDVPTG